ncbi:VENN motif pre-toxin domain-containing protein [Orbaceae bacterium ESL0721]|nr:VENN motif pre-toxin domain-containing protein [Orbaceae bacterium ESL0721]
MYNGKPNNELTEAEKENISALTQLALGIATATATGGDMDAAGAAVSAGKNSIENNFLDSSGNFLPGVVQQVGTVNEIIKESTMQCGDDIECFNNQYTEKMKDTGLLSGDKLSVEDKEFLKLLTYYIPGIGLVYAQHDARDQNSIEPLVYGGLGLVPVLTGYKVTIGTGAAFSMGANATYQLATKPIENFNIFDNVTAGVVGGVTANKGWLGTILWNSAGGATSAAVNGDNPVSGAIGGAAGGGSGSLVGSSIGQFNGSIFGEYVSDNIKDLFNKKTNDKNKEVK